MPIEHPPALYDLLDLARVRVRRETVFHHVLQDPGTGGYVAALEAVLHRGAGAIEASFDLVESLGSAPGPSGWAPRSSLHPEWIGLVAEHFPDEPAAARTLKQRLLAEGARWATKPRRL
jgi:hypothetical protein